MLVPQGMPCGTHGCHANHSPTKTELLPKATAQPERTLEAVGCSGLLGCGPQPVKERCHLTFRTGGHL